MNDNPLDILNQRIEATNKHIDLLEAHIELDKKLLLSISELQDGMNVRLKQVEKLHEMSYERGKLLEKNLKNLQNTVDKLVHEVSAIKSSSHSLSNEDFPLKH